MSVYFYATTPLVQPVIDFLTSPYHLARGKLSPTKAIEQGELWTQAALKLSLITAMFFSYRFALSMGNPLLTVSLIVVNTCIHPVANINALFLTSLIQYISALRQIGFHGSIRYSIHAEYLSKGVLAPERHQLFYESVAKGDAALANAVESLLGTGILMFSYLEYFDIPRHHISEDQVQSMTPLQKARHYSLWLDRKIIAASKVAAPHIAARFGYRPTTP